jgi:hypothetical protein
MLHSGRIIATIVNNLTVVVLMADMTMQLSCQRKAASLMIRVIGSSEYMACMIQCFGLLLLDSS